ncbi:unnamed protein product [Trichobilharzia regenti]|nr:unnamed protein product [Trichobilharzia regenti]
MTVYSTPSSTSSSSLSSLFSQGYNISSSTTCTVTSSTSSTITTTSGTVDKPISLTKENYLPKDNIASSHNYKVVSSEDDDCDITLNLSTVCPSK